MKRKKRDSEKNINFSLNENSTYSDVDVKPDNRSTGSQMYDYTIYVHTPKKEHINARAIVRYNSQLFKVIDDGIDEDEKFQVQERTYEKIETYSYDRSKDVHLLVKFNINRFEYDFFKRVNKIGDKWKQIDSIHGANLNIKGASDELTKIEYEINKSIKIQLEHSETIGYPVKIIENSGTDAGESPFVENLNIKVTEQRDFIEDNDYLCYVHDLTICCSRKGDLSDVAGLRLYDRLIEIKIYKDDREDEKNHIHYVPGTTKDNKLYVVFDPTDNTILLVCYNSKSYKAKVKKEPHKLFFESRLRSCEFTSRNKENIKKILKDIKDQLGRETIKDLPECKNQNHVSSIAQAMPPNLNTQNQDCKSDFWGKNKIYILSGGGAALGAVIIIGFGVLIYKKCVKARAPVFIDPML